MHGNALNGRSGGARLQRDVVDLVDGGLHEATRPAKVLALGENGVAG